MTTGYPGWGVYDHAHEAAIQIELATEVAEKTGHLLNDEDREEALCYLETVIDLVVKACRVLDPERPTLQQYRNTMFTGQMAGFGEALKALKDAYEKRNGL